MTPEQLDADLAHRARLDEEGLVGTIVVEPLTALAGGILGGITVAVVAWRLAWRDAPTRARSVRRRR